MGFPRQQVLFTINPTWHFGFLNCQFFFLHTNPLKINLELKYKPYIIGHSDHSLKILASRGVDGAVVTRHPVPVSPSHIRPISFGCVVQIRKLAASVILILICIVLPHQKYSKNTTLFHMKYFNRRSSESGMFGHYAATFVGSLWCQLRRFQCSWRGSLVFPEKKIKKELGDSFRLLPEVKR